jgi:DNA-binding MarR family transcriptional regulator
MSAGKSRKNWCGLISRRDYKHAGSISDIKTLTEGFDIAYIVSMRTKWGEITEMDSFESPGMLINRLAHAMALEMDRRLKAAGVTLSQWFVLKQLWRQEGKSQVELQELLDLERATVNGLIQRMVRSELIECRPDPSDRRVQRIFLTERGRALKQATPSFEEEVNACALQGFSEDERMFFIRLLTRALHNTTGK